ncbi:outer membrane protein assembly factor BamB family protein [Roseimaritima ulvae]|uniref:Outer membrane biogenesis protein BamB n=1 Tax=Roseimaritima ulvae TaxID=980254 RepID=A0A5B9QPH3_9BACT|nr:PQQ-binding-like beta-propeller repeat protein [Roseimaritima ulvae]QEG40987.1 outer membrane biogenesis protein BamB [Roseimaritima ulvae]
MVRLIRPALLFAALCCVSAGTCFLPAASVSAEDLLSPSDASRIGMVEAWRRQLSLIGGAQSAVDIQLHVDGSRKRHFIEVSHEKDGETHVLSRTDVNQLDAFGKPIGVEEARRLASLQVMRWKRRGITATLSENEIPQVRVYTLCKDGTVEARDAETGELYWLTRNGSPYQPYLSLGVNDDYVTFLNGSTLYQLSAETGKVIREFEITGSPSLGSVIAGQYALVPTTRGGIEGFHLEDSREYPFMQRMAGRATALPTRAPGTTRTAWATDAGYVYAMETEGKPSVTFRFDTDGVVSAELAAAKGDRFFFGSENGHVYAIRATRSGDVLWRHSIGQPIYSTAFVSENQLLVSSVYKNLYCLELATGAPLWKAPVPQIDTVLASTDDNLYARTSVNQLTVIGAKTGARVADVSNITVEKFVINRLTDRLYLVGAGGMLQCLRPVDSVLPQFKVVPEPTASADPDTPAAAAQPEAPRAADPFGAGMGADPFAPAGGDAVDPFAPAGGAAADPFAPADGAADPFAPADGGADPFGGDPFNN